MNTSDGARRRWYHRRSRPAGAAARWRSESGMVTAEIALGLTALGLVLAAGLWVVAVVADQVRCQDAARDVARAIARGETERIARSEGRRAAPEGARIRISGADGWAEVTVTVDASAPWEVIDGLGRVRIRAEAAVAYEPGESLDPASAIPGGASPGGTERGSAGPGGEELGDGGTDG